VTHGRPKKDVRSRGKGKSLKLQRLEKGWTGRTLVGKERDGAYAPGRGQLWRARVAAANTMVAAIRRGEGLERVRLRGDLRSTSGIKKVADGGTRKPIDSWPDGVSKGAGLSVGCGRKAQGNLGEQCTRAITH